MNWAPLGLGVTGFVMYREIEQIARRWFRAVRDEPDAELPDVELSDHERRAALDREITRRITER